jgi:hypothetical protein
MTMHKVTLLVRHVAKGQLMGLYVRDELEFPFVPTIGMQFKQGASSWLWETDNGELMPSIETVTYDLDDGVFVCLLTVDQPLKASFWTPIGKDKLANSIYVPYFQPRG